MLLKCAPTWRRMAGEPLLTLCAEGDGGARPAVRSGTRSGGGAAAMEERAELDEASACVGAGGTLNKIASPALPCALLPLTGISGVALPLRAPEDSRCWRTAGDLGDDDREGRAPATVDGGVACRVMADGGVAPATGALAAGRVEGAAWHCVLVLSIT